MSEHDREERGRPDEPGRREKGRNNRGAHTHAVGAGGQQGRVQVSTQAEHESRARGHARCVCTARTSLPKRVRIGLTSQPSCARAARGLCEKLARCPAKTKNAQPLRAEARQQRSCLDKSVRVTSRLECPHEMPRMQDSRRLGEYEAVGERAMSTWRQATKGWRPQHKKRKRQIMKRE
eukprot:6200233-Pleurochrysis_carterae.AAC.3